MGCSDSDPVYEWVRENPGWVIFIIGALAAHLWLRLREEHAASESDDA